MMFSIAIPAFKPHFLAKAVSSVLRQDCSDWELIIVDDCSPADLKSIVAQFDDSRIHYFRNDFNIGALDVVDNWNRCLEHCSGDYIICMGDDDELRPNCLSVLSELIGKYPNLGVYHCRTSIIDTEGQLLEVLPECPGFESSLQMLSARWGGRRQFIGDFCFSSYVLRRNGGFYKLPLAWGSDDITVYIASKGDGDKYQDGIANTNIPVFCYRINPHTISSQTDYKKKLQSMMTAADWFTAELKSRTAEKAEDKEVLASLQKKLKPFFASYALFYVREDIRCNKANFFYWLSHRKETRLPFPKLFLQSLKAFVI